MDTMTARTCEPITLLGRVVRDDIAGTRPGVDAEFSREADDTWRIGSTVMPVSRVHVSPLPSTETYRPSWATLIGALSLVLLVGILFFFIKRERMVDGALVELDAADGRVLTFTVADSDPVMLWMSLEAS